jgi:hypothetical protein
MGRKRRLFTVRSPLGYDVFLDRDRWRQIIRHKHPALAGRETEVRTCLASPATIRESAKEPEVHMYYVPVGQAHLCVVTAPANETEHFVVTAYYTANIKKGNELWRS